MEINVTFIVLLICAIVGICIGWKKGFAKRVAGFISLLATMLMLGLFLRIYYTYTNGQVLDTVVAVIVLVVLGAVYGILRIILKSVKAIANLPVIAVIDRMLGSVLGVIVVVVLYHIVIVAATRGYLGQYGSYMLTDIANNEWLGILARADIIEIIKSWGASVL